MSDFVVPQLALNIFAAREFFFFLAFHFYLYHIVFHDFATLSFTRCTCSASQSFAGTTSHNFIPQIELCRARTAEREMKSSWLCNELTLLAVAHSIRHCTNVWLSGVHWNVSVAVAMCKLLFYFHKLSTWSSEALKTQLQRNISFSTQKNFLIKLKKNLTIEPIELIGVFRNSSQNWSTCIKNYFIEICLIGILEVIKNCNIISSIQTKTFKFLSVNWNIFLKYNESHDSEFSSIASRYEIGRGFWE